MQSQSRNWLVFFGLFFVLMIAHSWLRNKLWPPPPPPPKPEQIWAFANKKPNAQRLLIADLIGSAGGASALNGVLTLACESALAPDAVDQFAVALAPKPPAEPPKPAEPPAKPDLYSLGGEGYLLDVQFTSQGAAVSQLVLTQFQEANRMGLAVKRPDGSPMPLHLIPSGDTPAYAMYHYARPDADEERPLDTLGRRNWSLVERKADGPEQSIAFVTELPEQNVRITKTYTLRPRELHLGLTVRVDRLGGGETTPFRYQLAGGRRLPIEGEWYTTIFRNTLVGWVNDKGVVERVLDDNQSLARSGGSMRYSRADRMIQYAAVTVQFFASAIVPAEDQPNRKFIEFVRATVESDPDPNRLFLTDVTVRAIAEPVDPKPGEPVEHKYLLYHGPVKVSLLNQLRGAETVEPAVIHRYDATLHLNTLTDYGKFGFWTDLIVFFTNLIHGLIGFLRHIVPNIHGRDGICIILVTVIVRGLMFPLSRRQAASMARTQEKMAKIQPEMKKIKERFKGDLMAQQQAMSELYKKHGVNPAAGLGGCLMVFLQMPVFLGLYFALQESFLFRLQRFLWAPNLTAPDMLFSWSDRIPWISDPAAQGGLLYLGPYFNLLPIVAVTLMVVQQKLMAPPALDEQARAQQKMMKYMMIFFGIMFYKVPAGLSLYFICSTAWGLAERKFLPKKPGASPTGGGDAQTPKATEKPPAGRNRAKSKPDEPGKLRLWWEKLLREASKK